MTPPNQTPKNSFWSSNKPLLFALAVSLIVHFFLLSQQKKIFKVADSKQQAINIRLVKAPSKPVKSAVPHPGKAEDFTNQEMAPEKQSTTATKQPNISSPIETQSPLSNTTASQGSATEAPTYPDQVAENQETSATIEVVPSAESIIGIINKNAHQQIDTEFEVRDSADPNTVSMHTITFITQADGTYQLTKVDTDLETSDRLTDVGTLQEKSEGNITAEGLKPIHYAQYYSGSSVSGRYANFDWSNASIQFDSHQEPLVIGTQDEISYMYQFMFFPPEANTLVNLTNGARMQILYFIYLGEEAVLTKLGSLRTIHLISDDKVKTELWLAVDYQFIPVKFRKTINDGSFIEQTASKISVKQTETVTH